MSRGVGHRRGSDMALLWLWHSPAAAALIRPLACEPPYAMGVVLTSKKKKKNCSNLSCYQLKIDHYICRMTYVNLTLSTK